MNADGVRVVLVRPGDLLVFGNVGWDTQNVDLEPIETALGLAGIIFFAADIDMAVVPRGS